MAGLYNADELRAAMRVRPALAGSRSSSLQLVRVTTSLAVQLERALCADPTPEETAARDLQQLPVRPLGTEIAARLGGILQRSS